MGGDDFSPAWSLRHAQLQSILATKSPRRRGWLRRGSTMEAVSQAQVLDAGDGVRLTGQHARQGAGIHARGLVVLIHGWEGSHESAYLYSMACATYAAGYDVFRLNLRDHGGSHHLNREMFHSARIDEVIRAIAAIPRADASQPLFVIGFSLGGNFALRVGLHGPAAGLHPALSLGICPSISPAATMHAIDRGPWLFRRYFMDKWRKTVAAKQRAFPELDMAGLTDDSQGLLGITARFVAAHTPYASLDDYFQAYTLSAEQLHDAASPLAIITAQDDPVVPFRDFADLRQTGSLHHLSTPARGGHCGFIQNFGLDCWTEQRTLQLLDAATRREQ